MELEITSQTISDISPDGSFIVNEESFDITFDPFCPHCHTSFKPIILNSYCDEDIIYNTFLCPHCMKIYFTNISGLLGSETIRVFPNNHKSIILPIEIEKISPGFVKIYKQASIAEEQELDEISGMGYRKALEFLIRDYALSVYPDKKDAILSTPLAKCIKEYIDNDGIKTLATASAWIGNDETHYLRHHADRDISDLKKFIDTIVSYFLFEITLKDAQSITHKNKK